ncbi:Mu transposase C-terminal domain-containing protein [Deinococcus petrolearius]|uniref:Mu transposase C-terminal domain-containing protein n=1 Tax=Deinococcus petrolearius TaxID=1751295 RepID=A0ABW1DLQ9_9DEIO
MPGHGPQVRALKELTGDTTDEPLPVLAANDTVAKRHRLERKRAFIDLYLSLQEVGIASAVEVAADGLGIARSTAYGWRHEWVTVAPLIKEYRSDAGQSRQTAQVEDVMAAAITRAHASDSAQTIRTLHRKLVEDLAKLNLPSVSYATVCRRVAARPRLERLTPHLGRRAKERLRPSKEGHVGQDPLDLVEIDHWMIDMILLNDHDRQPVGVAYLTLLLDTATRVVLGYYLSFDPPSVYSVGRALYCAFMPKTELLSELGIEGEWPCWGIPNRLRPDNAQEFKSPMLRDLALKYQFQLTPARPGRPRDKAKIEAFFGTLSRFVKELPGSTKSHVEGRTAAVRDATRTLSEMEVELVDFFVNRYHRSVHGTLQCTPLKAYQQAVEGQFNLRQPGNPTALLVDVLPRLTAGRMVREPGVTVHTIMYWHDRLLPLIGNGQKYIIKYDPYDLSSVWLLNGKEYIRLPYKNKSYPFVTLREYKQAQAGARAAGLDPSDADQVMGFYRRSAARTEKSRQTTRVARRARAHITTGEVTVQQPTLQDRLDWKAGAQPLPEDR